MTSLSVGDTAPGFTLPADGGGEISLAETLKQGPVVLYFYPKDDTPGCTKEAIAFTEALPAFRKAKVTILGCSKDSVAKHDRFIAKHELGIRLVADTEGEVCEAYGVWVEKTMYGRTSMGIQRSTFLIGTDGRIKAIWPKVKVAGHADEVLAAVQAG
ncbi:peroxiredoxin [Marinibaculum pumilum]|uniref:thioredoxin-dependent peroxiredoxin n=1 Tax=Marinibaculum pumilum TaxID=1766165 RepID=A0ABV7KWR3_9PROT